MGEQNNIKHIRLTGHFTILVNKPIRIKEIQQFLYDIINKSIFFLAQLKKDFVHTGAVSPSSKSLAKNIVSIANLPERHCIVELGTGTGVFTEEILKNIYSSKFFSLELNNSFVNETKKRCPVAKVYHDDAKNLKKYLKKNNEETCDCVISGLPWTNFDEQIQNELLDTIYDNLGENGIFITFTYFYTPLFPQGKNFKNKLNNKFKTVIQTKTIWNNLPPAFLYYCTK